MKNLFEITSQFEAYKDIPSSLQYGSVLDENYLISIVMPVYKHPFFFRIALKSAIDQDFDKPYEIIVVDDDDSEYNISPNFAVVKEANSNKVKYYKNSKNLGLCGNWNRCIQLAKGKYIVYCHDDEKLMPYALTRLYRLSKETNGKSAIFPNKNSEYIDGRIKLYPEKNKLFGVFPRKEMYKSSLPYFLDRTLGNGAGALLNKECLLELGGYDPDFYPCSDYVIDILYSYKFGAYRTNYALVTSRQGDSLSFQVYHLFSDRMKEIRECIKSLIKAPDFLLQLIIDAKYRTSKVAFDIVFGKKNISYSRETKFVDRVISKLYTYYIDLKKYKLL